MKEVNEAIYDLDISQKNELVQYEYDLLNIENDIENLKRKIDFIQSQLVECVMRSTLNGQVLDRHEEPGKYAAQNTKLLTIANLSEPVLKIQVPEKDITRIKLHDPVLVDLNGTVYNGYIFRIDPKAKKDENAFIPSIEVEIRFKDIPQKILFGASATAKITVDIRKDALYLPRGAYLITGEEKYVYKIEGNKARKLKVIFGLMTGKEVEIVDGLKEGDTVIISGYQDFTQFDMINLDSDRGNKVD
jgi:HlyD family secretion protein